MNRLFGSSNPATNTTNSKSGNTVTFSDSSRVPSGVSVTRNSAFDSWEVGSRYALSERLGKGSYGEVVKALDTQTNKQVAIKQMKHVFEEPTDAKRAYREIHILRHLRHPSIVSLFDVLLSSIDQTYLQINQKQIQQGVDKVTIPRKLGNLYLVFEFIDTDLSKIMKSNQYLTEEHIQYILYQILEGLSYIHRSNVIHRDLKPANVLINCADCTVKIADFGLSRVVGSDLIVSHIDQHDVAQGSDSAVGSGNPMDEDVPSPAVPLANTANNNAAMEEDRHSGSASSVFAFLSSHSASEHHVTTATSANTAAPPPIPSALPAPLPPPLPLKRGLTKHVVTRWYRAPEVILLQPYTAAVDLWSVGCIFAELLGLLRENIADFKKRRALFPGESCGELSADDLAQLNRRRLAFSDSTSAEEEHQRLIEESFGNSRSQLNIIFDLIGTPRVPQDTSFIRDNQILHYLTTLSPRNPRNVRDLYPAASNLAIDLLAKLLAFHPDKRITASEALNHPFFDNLKRKDYVTTYRTKCGNLLNPVPMNAEIEKVGESEEFLRQNIVKEVLYYRRSELMSLQVPSSSSNPASPGSGSGENTAKTTVL